MRRRLTVLLDPELAETLDRIARARGLTASQVARDGLRNGLGIAEQGWDSGFKEGYYAAKREFRENLNRTLHGLETESATS